MTVLYLWWESHTKHGKTVLSKQDTDFSSGVNSLLQKYFKMPNFLSHVQYWPLNMMTYHIFPFPQVLQPGPWFNIKMSFYQYRKYHCGDKMILRPSYLHNGITYTDKMTSLYWIRTQVLSGRKHTVWTSYQIHKSAGCACADNAGNLFPATTG